MSYSPSPGNICDEPAFSCFVQRHEFILCLFPELIIESQSCKSYGLVNFYAEQFFRVKCVSTTLDKPELTFLVFTFFVYIPIGSLRMHRLFFVLETACMVANVEVFNRFEYFLPVSRLGGS